MRAAENRCKPFIRKRKTTLKETIEIINEITKYGLSPNLKIEDKDVDLEKNLVRIYSKFFEIRYKYEDKDYPDFKKVNFPSIVENVRNNFPKFGFYHEVLNSHELNKEAENAIGDAIDDLSDIIFDLLEIKWRKENNSEQDALWFFEFIFRSHTQQHIISLLNFIKSKNG